MSSLLPVPAFDDNYIWLLHDGIQALVVDPGDAAPVHAALAQHHLTLVAILLTHHHGDHTGGIAALRSSYGVPVYGPANSPAHELITHPLENGDSVVVSNWQFAVITVPGHTLDHIAFHSVDESILFCGDTLFLAGCGRVFEGTHEQMYQSLQKLAVLPEDTRVCCAHEYTLSNLRFAATVEPDNTGISDYIVHCEKLRQDNQPTLPSTLGLEKSVNPFLHCQNAGEFTRLREWKNRF